MSRKRRMEDTGERLERVERVLDKVARVSVKNADDIEVNNQKIEAYRLDTERLIRAVEMQQETTRSILNSMESMQREIVGLQREIVGLRTESRRMLDYLLGEE